MHVVPQCNNNAYAPHLQMPTPLRALSLDVHAEMDQAGEGSGVVGGTDKVIRVFNYDSAEVGWP